MTVKPFGTSITKHKLQAHTAPYTAIHCPHTRAVYWPAPRHNSAARGRDVWHALRAPPAHTQTHCRPDPDPGARTQIYRGASIAI
jgi:hypothetical protein